ncbi:MAG: RNA polymerase sigma factor [Anaerolineae bacterium]
MKAQEFTFNGNFDELESIVSVCTRGQVLRVVSDDEGQITLSAPSSEPLEISPEVPESTSEAQGSFVVLRFVALRPSILIPREHLFCAFWFDAPQADPRTTVLGRIVLDPVQAGVCTARLDVPVDPHWSKDADPVAPALVSVLETSLMMVWLGIIALWDYHLANPSCPITQIATMDLLQAGSSDWQAPTQGELHSGEGEASLLSGDQASIHNEPDNGVGENHSKEEQSEQLAQLPTDWRLAIAACTPEEQQIIELVREGCTYDEIARDLKRPKAGAAIKQQAYRLRKTLGVDVVPRRRPKKD